LTEPRDKLMPLGAAIRQHVRPGMHLHFASSPSRSNAAIRELARAFRGSRPEFTLSATGFHSMAHLLAILRLGRIYMSCFFGDNYPTPRPNPLYGELVAAGVELEHWSLFSYVSAFRAGALGHSYALTNSLSGTTLGDELAYKGRFFEVSDPRAANKTIGLVSAIRADIAFVHAAAGDRFGHAVASPPYSEGFWGALGAEAGVIVTVDHLVDSAVCRKYAEWVGIPAHRVLAICHEPFGAHPQPSYVAARGPNLAGYQDDFEHYELWRRMATDASLFAEFSRKVLDAEDGSLGYRQFVGEARLESLRAPGAATISRRPLQDLPHPTAAAERHLSANDRLVVLAARTICRRVVERGYRTILAGIGVSFTAARLAKWMLDRRGVPVEVMVETGMADVECGPTAHPFLLASLNMAQAGRLSSVEEVLGTSTCGSQNACLGVLGAAEIDQGGNINSTRLPSGQLLVGSGGANDIASSCREVVAVVKCERARLVPKVHYLTSPGKVVLQIATERCVLSRESAGHSWTIRDLYPTAKSLSDAVREIKSHCGFALADTAPTDWGEAAGADELLALEAMGRDGPEPTQAPPLGGG